MLKIIITNNFVTIYFYHNSVFNLLDNYHFIHYKFYLVDTKVQVKPRVEDKTPILSSSGCEIIFQYFLID